MKIDKPHKDFLAYFLLAAGVFLLIQSVGYYRGITGNRHAELVDTDAYMRLVRVEQLAETGDWYDSTIRRSNFPYGDNLHWTRPLDVILLAGAYLLTPFTGFKQGLLYWGIILSPFMGICSLLALHWATRRVLNMEARRLLWLIFIAQPLLMQVFSFGRPDHHSLLMLLFILLLGCLFRIAEQPENKRHVLLGGSIAAFAMWVSVESIFTVIMVYITLVFLWLVRGKAYARQLLLFSLSVLLLSMITLLIERPPSALSAVEYDKMSLVHLFVFMLAAMAAYLLTVIKNAAIFSRLVKAAAIGVTGGLIIWLVFPAFYLGPMAGVNKAIIPIWLSKVSEAQPLWALEPYYKTIIIGPIVLFLIYFSYLVLKKRYACEYFLLIPLASGFITFLPAGIYQVRMNYYLLMIIIILLSLFLSDIIERISELKMGRLFKPIARVLVMSIFLVGLPSIGILLSLGHSLKNDIIKPDLKAMSRFLYECRYSDSDAMNIFTHLDFGPELLYRTKYNVIAGPYHRNDAGILYTYQVMAADSFEQAKTMLDGRTVDLLLLCPKSTERIFYKKTLDQSTFYERLVSGERPEYLEQVDLPQDLSKSFIVLKVK